MSPSPRLAVLVALAGASALLIPAGLAVAVAIVLLGLGIGDALAVRRSAGATRELPHILSRGVPTTLTAELVRPSAGAVRLRQPAIPDLRVEGEEGEGELVATLTAQRRGRHTLPPLALRQTGPLGLGRWDHRAAGTHEVLVFPDLHAARRLVLAVRQGRRREPGLRSRGPLGLGTEFELVREYAPDDDVRQVNWRATARVGRPMSNQYRTESEKDVVLLLDAGRLMAAPLGAERTRMDVALDAAAAVALVVDEVGDRCGVLAYDDAIRRRLPPARGGGERVVRTIFDLEPSDRDADAELAFRTVGNAKRAFVLVLTDLLDPAAARPLVRAIPVLARRHAVVVASARDPDVEALATAPPDTEQDVLRAAVALDVLAARDRAEALVERAGARVVQAPAGALAATCVRAYLRAKARARL